MNNLAALRNPGRGLLPSIVLRLGMPPRAADHRSSSGFDDRTESLLHIRGHLPLVLAPLPVKAQHGNAPLIFHVGVRLAVALFVGNHLAPSAESDHCAVGAAAFLLQAGSIAFVLSAHAVEAAHSGQVASAAKLNVISAQELVLLSKAPP